jgi:DNA-binding GntR family transcriptional regulator
MLTYQTGKAPGDKSLLHDARTAPAGRKDRPSKAALVYDDLRGAIVGLRLKPGTRVDKHEICARLDVSRQPVAEAIARLADERLLDVAPQRGTFVARIRLSDVIDGIFIRRALETATVETIAPGIDAATLARLEENLAEGAAAIAAKDWEAFYALDVRFHALLIDRLARGRVREVVETSRAQLERVRRLTMAAPGRVPDTHREHKAILAALTARDAGRAAAAMAAHLDAVLVGLRKYAAREPDLFEP